MTTRKELDPLESITASMTNSIPQFGDNVLKNATLVMICKNIGCATPLTVTGITKHKVVYSCPEHGKRNYAQFDWLDITGSTMLEFRKVGLQ